MFSRSKSPSNHLHSGLQTALLALAATFTLSGHAALPQAVGETPMPTLAPMVKRVTPAVVNIATRGTVRERQPQNPLLEDPFFRRFFDIPDMGPRERQFQAAGSGVIFDAKNGYIVTNAHVVDNATEITVTLQDGRDLIATIVGTDAPSDVAVLKVKPDNLIQIALGDSAKLEQGDFVVAIGNPFGIGQTVTSGIVSALGRSGLGNAYENFIQTDASINPGNSGGALVNLKGELVGINSQIVSRTGASVGIGFAIPANQARYVLGEILAHGSVVRGRIGIGGQNVTPELAKAFGLPAARGAVITQVVADSPAAKAGLKPEDIILEAEGREVRDFDQLRNMIGLHKVGDRIDLKVLRDGKPRTIGVVVGKNTEQAEAGAKLHPKLAGAVFAPVDEATAPEGDARGVLVQRVVARSPAARIGLRPGDIIIGVNRQRVNGMKEFEKLAGEDQKQLLLHVRRGNNAFFIVVQ